MKPQVSVLICTYNRKALLKEALDSVLRQDFKDLEIIVSDDNSNDGTKNLLQNYTQKYKNIVYVLNQRYKKGPNGNKNNALDYAKGKYILFLDDDDELLNGAISSLMNEINKGYAHVFANCFLQKEGKITQEFSGKGFEASCEVSKKDFLLSLFSGEFLGIFEKALLENERFDDEFWGLESVLWVKLYAKKSFYLHKALRLYKIQKQSVSNQAFTKALRVYKGYLKMAVILEEEMKKTKDKAYARNCALNYKMAAYYAKLGAEYKIMYYCLFKSLSISFNFPAFILLCLSFIPQKMLISLSKIRVGLKCKN